MVENPLTTIFGFIGSFYGLVIPLCTLFFLAILFLASMTVPGAKPKAVGQAIYTYIMHGTSVLLMTIGAFPTVFSVFAGVPYLGRTYIALLLVFACGGLLFLMQDQETHNLDSASRAIPEALYMTTLKVIGNLLAILSTLSILLSIVLASFQTGWWVTPFVTLVYGLLLSWCTRGSHDWELFKTMQMTAAPAKVVASQQKAKVSTPAPVKKKKKAAVKKKKR
ncbi:hypothetical protein COU75_02620 [Candidatus Peregrinibacteria bacterium CG10_big_fil_rev_8_21_14_0_10_42_8]|nr:MAG: hypothetical protein COU75_02620 [Candidatus Peregrinibacteria bacterium CG10_big_fil_rev_8_21_14_0_10_42_8]